MLSRQRGPRLRHCKRYFPLAPLVSPEASSERQQGFRSCTCTLRINTPGSPADCHSGKKAEAEKD